MEVHEEKNKESDKQLVMKEGERPKKRENQVEVKEMNLKIGG